MYREFSLANSTIQTIKKSRTKIINAFEQNGSRLKRFRKPERCVVSEAPLKWSKPVFLNRQAAARYRALAPNIPGRERFNWKLSF